MTQFHKINQLFLKRFRNIKPNFPNYVDNISYEQLTTIGMPWLELDLHIPYKDILDEIHSIDNLLVAHRDDRGEHPGWHSFSIHGKSETATRETSYYSDNRPMQWTDKMPRTVQWFKDVYPADNFNRVRVMRLDPGGYISIHSDTENSRLDPVNISITQPEGCDFVMEKHGLVPFTMGTAMWLDVSNRHTVINDSDKPRYHLIVHAKPNKDFEDIALKSYKKFYNKG
jgi:hypothetical protein